MRMPRISIATLMAFVLFLGVTLAAFRAATEHWERAMLTLAIASSGLALVGLLSTRGRSKATWIGYFVFGTGYLTLCIGPWCDEHIMPHLVATPLFDGWYSKMQYTPTRVGERVWTSNEPGRGFAGGEVFDDVDATTVNYNVVHDRGTTSRYNSAQLRAISPDGYRRLCHSTLSLWIALLGALLARYFAGRADDEFTSRAAPERA